MWESRSRILLCCFKLLYEKYCSNTVDLLSLLTAKLAGLPAFYGLYSSMVPPFIFPTLSTSRQLGVGPAALVCLILVSGLSKIVEEEGLTDPESSAYITRYTGSSSNGRRTSVRVLVVQLSSITFARSVVRINIEPLQVQTHEDVHTKHDYSSVCGQQSGPERSGYGWSQNQYWKSQMALTKTQCAYTMSEFPTRPRTPDHGRNCVEIDTTPGGIDGLWTTVLAVC